MHKTFLRTFLISTFFLISFFTSAQEQLSLQDVIGIALKNNYSILMSGNDYEITKNNNSLGNAGMLPSVTGTAGANQTVNNLKQDYTDGRVIDKNNVGSTALNAGVTLNWTLFNGMQMFATKGKLEEIEARGELTYKLEVEKTVQQVISAYFNVVQRQKLLKTININIAIDSERVVLAQTKLDIGSGSRLDLLQAKVDLNEQTSTKMKLVASIEEGKDNLNYLLSRKPGTDFTPSDSIVITYKSSPSALRTSVPENNYSIRVADREQRISLYGLKESKAERYPVINLSSGYNYLRNKNDAGFLLLNQNTGLNYGVALQWNLFNGSNTSRQIKNAELIYKSSEYNLSDLKLQVSTELEKAIRDFENNLNILRLEQDNILLAQENLSIAVERYRSGLSNSLELREAQLSFEDADVRLATAQYDAKLAETELMRLNGELVK